MVKTSLKIIFKILCFADLVTRLNWLTTAFQAYSATAGSWPPPRGMRRGFSMWTDMGPCLCTTSRAAGAAGTVAPRGLVATLALAGFGAFLEPHLVVAGRRRSGQTECCLQTPTGHRQHGGPDRLFVKNSKT